MVAMGQNAAMTARINPACASFRYSRNGANRHYKRVGCIRDIEVETTSLSEYIK